MVIIPGDATRYFWQQITTLDGVDYQLEFRYNEREKCYYMMVSLTDGTLLAQGIKLVSNYRLLQAYNDARMPLGEIICWASGADDSPAALGDLDQRVSIVYYTQAEMQAAGLDGWRL